MSANEKRTVLVVDDNAGLREFVRTCLEIDGFHVLDCESVEDAQELLDEAESELSLMLVDVNMPKLDGWAFLEWVRDSVHAAVPVVLYSGMFESDPARAERMGAQAFLGKPFSADRLIETTRLLLPPRRAGRRSLIERLFGEHDRPDPGEVDETVRRAKRRMVEMEVRLAALSKRVDVVVAATAKKGPL